MLYVRQHQALDREERVAWRDVQKLYAEEKKSAEEIQMAKTQAEAEEKKRADEIQAEEKMRENEIRILLVKIEADKELTLKEMELKAQAQASSRAAVDPPPCNRVTATRLCSVHRCD